MRNEELKILLHSCCAPCSISVVSELKKEYIELSLFWYNPNIKPEEEYEKRLNCLIDFASNENIKLIRVNPRNPRANSCELCYRARLEKTAEYAAQNNYEAFTTTLLISPYQNHETIKQIGEEAAARYGVAFLYRDFRPFFKEGQKEARARGFYMQKYCGCGKTANREQGAGSNVKEDKFDRLELLTGKEGLERLKNTKVIVFGVGGVGSWCCEALARSGIGKIDIVDFDTVCESNINRQLQATCGTVGMSKALALKQRLLDINPDCKITAHEKLFSKENAASFNIEKADYVIDAIDMMRNKIDLIETVCEKGVKLYSSMGMALKTDPLKIKTASVWKTDVCPLARLVRQGLRRRGFTGDFTAVYSVEEVLTRKTRGNNAEDAENFKRINGSIATVTASAGLILASLIIQDVINKNT